jgi:hypothetical protein
MPLLIIAAGVALLLVLMIGFKVNGFIALVLVAAVVGLPKVWMRRPCCTPFRGHWRNVRRPGDDSWLWRHAGEADF